METVTDIIFLGSKITADGDRSHEVKTLAPWKKNYDKPRQRIKKQRDYFADKCPSSQSYRFSSSPVWMWELDHKEGWASSNWCFWPWCGEDSWEPLGLRKHPDPALLKKHEKFQVVWHRKAIIKKEKEKLLELFLDKNTKHRKIEGDAKFSEFLFYETSVLTVFIPSSLILIWHLISFRSSQQFIFIIASALATVNSAFYKHYTCLGPSDSLMCRLAFTIICLLCAIWWGS